MWQPDKRQWRVIWITVVLVFLFRLLASLSQNSQDETIFSAIAAFSLVVGVLLVWRRQPSN
jgi:asparagine N-glycosylation enzyme membrane subunit Stt3